GLLALCGPLRRIPCIAPALPLAPLALRLARCLEDLGDLERVERELRPVGAVVALELLEFLPPGDLHHVAPVEVLGRVFGVVAPEGYGSPGSAGLFPLAVLVFASVVFGDGEIQDRFPGLRESQFRLLGDEAGDGE